MSISLWQEKLAWLASNGMQVIENLDHVTTVEMETILGKALPIAIQAFIKTWQADHDVWKALLVQSQETFSWSERWASYGH